MTEFTTDGSPFLVTNTHATYKMSEFGKKNSKALMSFKVDPEKADQDLFADDLDKINPEDAKS